MYTGVSPSREARGLGGRRLPNIKTVKDLFNSIDQQMAELVEARGVYFHTLAEGQKWRPRNGTFQWVVPLPNDVAALSDATWYVDGSAYNNDHVELVRYGYSIVRFRRRCSYRAGEWNPA